MSDWHVGQLVVCVDDAIDRENGVIAYPVKGCVYTIREIDDGWPHDERGVGLLFEEIINPGLPILEPAFYSWRFRPVRKTSIEVFTAMLNDIPQMEDA